MRGSTLIGLGLVALAGILVLDLVLPDRDGERNELSDGTRTGQEGVNTATGTNPEQSATSQPTPSSEASPQSSNPPTAKPPRSNAPVEPLKFPDWPKPKLALVLTGEMKGYFEPCGCTENQLGGMNRRADLVRKMTDLGWTVRGADLGTLMRRTGRQAQIKFETTLAALRDIRYVALGLGPEELRLDPGYLISQHVTDGEKPLSLLSSNLVFYGSPEIGTPLSHAIIEHDGLKVGFTSAMSDSVRKTVIPDRDPGAADAGDISWSDPALALAKVKEHFDKERVAFRVLLAQCSGDESRELAKKYPEFDLVVTAQEVGEGNPKPEMIGNVRLLAVGEKGKHAGVIGIYPDDAANPVRFELVTLTGDHFGESAVMIDHMKSYQERLFDEKIVQAETEVAHPSGSTFVGAAKCGECHAKAFEIWKSTPHAHGFESLDPVHKRPGHERLNGIARVHDPECLSCHVTGWDPAEYIRFQSGFINASMADTDEKKTLQELLAGNQCENCHGPGSRHVELIEAGRNEEAAKLVRLPLDVAERTCVKCHDLDNSPEFKFPKYWDEVKHYGKD